MRLLLLLLLLLLLFSCNNNNNIEKHYLFNGNLALKIPSEFKVKYIDESFGSYYVVLINDVESEQITIRGSKDNNLQNGFKREIVETIYLQKLAADNIEGVVNICSIKSNKIIYCIEVSDKNSYRIESSLFYKGVIIRLDFVANYTLTKEKIMYKYLEIINSIKKPIEVDKGGVKEFKIEEVNVN